MRTKKVAALLTLFIVALAVAGCAGSKQASEDDTEKRATTEGSNGGKGCGREATLELQGEPGTEFSDTANASSNVTSESRAVSGFDEVELHGVGNLSIQQTGSESLTVEAEEDVLPKIRTEVENNRLIIGPEPGASIHTTEPINYTLTVDDLSALEVSGSGNVEAEGISTGELAVTVDGTGDVEISGRADSQEIDVSGSGDYRAEALESREVTIDVGGAGSAIINVSDELDAEVSGSGSVEYIGDPTVDQDISGAGEVRRKH